MLFAIDIDGTWSRDPIAFQLLVQLLKRQGHDCIIVTRRPHWTPDMYQFDLDPSLRIIYCNLRFKREVCEQLGLIIAIWIDDEPGTVEPQRILNNTL